MLVGRVKLQLVAFLLLSGGVAANIFVLQPHSWERLAGLKAQPRTALASAERFVGDTGSIGGMSGARAADRPGLAGASISDQQTGGAVAVEIPKDQTDITRAVQRELQLRGYETGAADGVAGLVTRGAIMGFEFDHGMPMTGKPSQQLLKTILLGAQGRAAPRTGGVAAAQSAEAESLIKSVQTSLAALGYRPGRANGRLTPETARAIREFEVDQSLPESGRLSGPLVARLTRLSAQGRVASGP
jgi:peptidoglycan hydrolase-like protein with peptidoglycan-binding domain